jgi:type IV secretory pathway VirB2 component (pilin)
VKRIITILLILFSSQIFPQLFSVSKKSINTYAQLGKDSAHVEVYHVHRYSVVLKNEDFLLFHDKSDTVFIGEQYRVLRKGGDYFLVDMENPGTKEKLNPVPLSSNSPEFYRKANYYGMKARQLRRLQDSLSGPLRSAHISLQPLHQSGPILYAEYVRHINRISDSLSPKIIELKDTSVERFYNIDKLTATDSSKIYKLLATADYRFYYGQYILNSIAIQHPQLLVRYIGKHPSNEKIVLKTIRWHPNMKAMITSVKETPIQSKEKKRILKQERKHVAGNVAAGVAYIGIIVAEIGLLVLLVKWLAN